MLSLLLLIYGTVVCQETWSLDACITYAIDQNLQLNDFKYTNASNKENYKQSIRNLLPSLSGYSDYDIRYGRSIDPNTNEFVENDFFSNSYSLNSSVDIFQGFQRINAIKASKFLYAATQEDLQQQKYLLAFRIMSAYYDILFFEELMIVSKQQEEISQANYALVKKQIDLGTKAGADLYEAESILLTDQLAVTQSSNQLELAKLTLKQEMNYRDTKEITVQNNMITKSNESLQVTLDSDTIFDTAKSFMPIIKSQELRVKAAKKDIAIARGGLYPTLSLFASYRTGFFETTVDEFEKIIPFRDQFKDNARTTFGVAINIPISNKWSARLTIKQQKIALKRAHNNLEVQKQELYQLIQQLVQDHNSLQSEYQQSTQKMESQNLAFTIAQKRYQKGLINALDLFQAKNLLASAQNENLQVRFRLKVNESTLEFYNGLPVFNINRNN